MYVLVFKMFIKLYIMVSIFQAFVDTVFDAYQDALIWGGVEYNSKSSMLLVCKLLR